MANEDYQTKIAELKKLIKLSLEACDKTVTPEVCLMSSDPDTYPNLEKMILEMIIKGGHTIGSAIIDIEKSYNVNMIND